MSDLTPMDVESKIITIRNQQVILDCDVAELYGVETKEINQAVRNNPNKFPEGYVFQLDIQEKDELVKIFDRFEKQKHSTVVPRAFTEKGLYMLATILKGSKAVETTLAIVEAYAKLKELSRVIVSLPAEENDESERQSLLHRGGQLIGELLDTTMPKQSSETSFELNLALLKLKHSVKRENDEELKQLKQQMEKLQKELAKYTSLFDALNSD